MINITFEDGLIKIGVETARPDCHDKLTNENLHKLYADLSEAYRITWDKVVETIGKKMEEGND